jgi:transcriptional regulator with XRE-family HTH domain
MNRTAERIAALRLKKGLTQEDLADLLFVSRSLVSMWELGVRMPDYSNVVKLAKIFNIREVDLVGEEQYVYSLEYEMKQVLEEIGEFANQTQTANTKADYDKAIKDFLDRLNETDRNLFMSRYFWMKTHKAIASDFDMSEAAVKVRISRIRKKLKKQIRGV